MKWNPLWRAVLFVSLSLLAGFSEFPFAVSTLLICSIHIYVCPGYELIWKGRMEQYWYFTGSTLLLWGETSFICRDDFLQSRDQSYNCVISTRTDSLKKGTFQKWDNPRRNVRYILYFSLVAMGSMYNSNTNRTVYFLNTQVKPGLCYKK